MSLVSSLEQRDRNLLRADQCGGLSPDGPYISLVDDPNDRCESDPAYLSCQWNCCYRRSWVAEISLATKLEEIALLEEMSLVVKVRIPCRGPVRHVMVICRFALP